jgi:hypothetical protein
MRHHFTILVGPLSKFIGMRIIISPDRSVISIDQDEYTAKVLRRFSEYFKGRVAGATPMLPKVAAALSKLQQHTTEEGKAEMSAFPYRAVIGCLNWAAVMTKPHLCYYVSKLAPIWPTLAWRTGRLCWMYWFFWRRYRALRSFITVINLLTCLMCRACSQTLITLATWTGLVPRVWQCKTQDSASGGGSAESEYKVFYLLCVFILWYRQFMAELGYDQLEPTIVYEDNQSCIDFSANPIHQSNCS